MKPAPTGSSDHVDRPEPVPPVEDAVWRALSDPTRRALLDLLADGALTTGRLAERFEMSRFGVMKHLEVLRGAGLVRVEERGRERWNHLDPVPIRRIEERWLRPFTRRAAERVLGVAARAEALVEHDAGPTSVPTASGATAAPTRALPPTTPFPSPSDPTMSTQNAPTTEPATVFCVRCEVRIDAPRAAVWEALVGDVSGWWHPAYQVRPDNRGIRLEPVAGGHLVEDWGDGEGLVWGEVVVVKRHETISVCGDTAGQWGGPSRSFMTWELEPDGDHATRLRFVQEGFGRATDETVKNLDGGWIYLFEECLKRFVETGSIAGAPELG